MSITTWNRTFCLSIFGNRKAQFSNFQHNKMLIVHFRRSINFWFTGDCRSNGMPSPVTEGERKRRNNTKRILGKKVACNDEMYERVTEVWLNLKISLFLRSRLERRNFMFSKWFCLIFYGVNCHHPPFT